MFFFSKFKIFINLLVISFFVVSLNGKHKYKCNNFIIIIITITVLITILNTITQFTHIKNWSVARCTTRWKQQIVVTFTVRESVSLEEILSSKWFFTVNTYEVFRMPHTAQSHYHLHWTTYEGRSIDESQNGMILLIFKIWKIRDIGFVRNLILSNRCKIYYSDVTVASFVNDKYGGITAESIL